MNIAELTLEQAQELVEAQRDDIQVKMSGRDACDHYFIIEDRRWYEQNLYSDSYFMLFIEPGERAVVCKRHDTMVEAVIQYAYHFTLDNCDTADAGEVPHIHKRHDNYQTVLADLALVERNW